MFSIFPKLATRQVKHGCPENLPRFHLLSLIQKVFLVCFYRESSSNFVILQQVFAVFSPSSPPPFSFFFSNSAENRGHGHAPAVNAPPLRRIPSLLHTFKMRKTFDGNFYMLKSCQKVSAVSSKTALGTVPSFISCRTLL